MRRKERSGPGIMNSDGVADTAVSGLAGSPAWASRQLQEAEASKRMETRRGDFTAGFLPEPAYLTQSEHVAESRDGRSSAKIEEYCMPGLVIPGPDAKFQCPPKYPIRGD